MFIESEPCRAMEFIDYHGVRGFYGQRSVEHLSDAFKGGEDGDNGLNAGVIEATISWRF